MKNCQKPNIKHLKQIGEVKKLDVWVPHELTENFKNCFKVPFFSYSNNNNNRFSITL